MPTQSQCIFCGQGFTSRLLANHSPSTITPRAAGKRLAFVDSKALDQLAALLRRATALMEGAGQPGWLLRMAAEEHAHEEFVGLHNSVLEILQVSA